MSNIGLLKLKKIYNKNVSFYKLWEHHIVGKGILQCKTLHLKGWVSASRGHIGCFQGAGLTEDISVYEYYTSDGSFCNISNFVILLRYTSLLQCIYVRCAARDVESSILVKIYPSVICQTPAS